MISGFVGILEIVSIFVRPVSLGLRLTANMIGGHLIVEMLLDVYLMLTLMVIYCPGFSSIVYFLLFLVPISLSIFMNYVLLLSKHTFSSYTSNLLT